MAQDSSFIWLRPATEMERVMDYANRKGLFVTVSGITLRSTVPLDDNYMKEALHHLFRKVPNLRMCFRSREDTLWACEMKREELNFQLTETQEMVPAVEALLQYRFPTTEGPLWCARLLPAGVPGRCSRPELVTAFPYSRTLLLANHHGIADGTTNMFFVDAFLRLLEDVVEDKPIDDSVQLGKLVAGVETQAILTERIVELTNNEDLLHQLLEDTNKLLQEKKLISLAYPMPRDPTYKSQIVLRDLDKETTQSFIKKCKKEGVTVNSGLTAVLNVGLVDFVRKGGLEQDNYRIHQMQSVNMRRYWSGDTSGTLGMHMMEFDNIDSTPAKWQDKFWNYARSVHNNIVKCLNERSELMHMIKIEVEDNLETCFEERPLPECDYGPSNMMDIDSLIPTEGQYIRIAHMLLATSCWNQPMYYMFHTLRGCLMFSFIYASDILTRELGQELVNITFKNLEAVMQL